MNYSSYTKLEDEKTSRLLSFGLQSQETCYIQEISEKMTFFNFTIFFLLSLGDFKNICQITNF